VRPSPFSESLAHPGDPLPLHLLRVAEQASGSLGAGARPEARLVAYLAGLFHDLGKATAHFQQYLHTERRTRFTPHARVSAALAWWYTANAGLPLWVRLAVLIAIFRHHGALNQEDWGQLLLGLRGDFREDDPVLSEQLSSLDLEGIGRWLEETLPRSVAGFPLAPPVLPPTSDAVRQAVLSRQGAGLRDLRKAFPGLDEALVFLAGFGGLLAADKVDAATRGSEFPRRELPAGAVAAYKAAQFTGPPGVLDEQREQIAAVVERTWLAHPEERLFTLTAPTGSGKTLAVLNAALKVREALRVDGRPCPRILYCLPFTSVIDQNHEVFRAVLRAGGAPDREDVLLKHHHLVDGLYRTEGLQGEVVEHQPDGAGQLLTETWQSEVVVTTFYQLLHSLLSRRNGNLKRAGQLAGSLVLLDEVQAVPLRYWRGLRHLFQAAARALDTRFVLLTATRPLIFRPEDAVELLPDHDQHFRALSRVRLHCRHREPTSLATFGEHLAETCAQDPRPTLVILNRTAAVGELFAMLRETLPERKLIALSTRLTPRDRRARIRLVRRLLRAGEPCILISTQLIEAGVDVSFPVVHRDLGPLDSVIQAAGRCNRHGAGVAPGEVHLWRLVATKADGQPGSPLWQRVYDSSLVEATLAVLGERETWEEAEFLDLSRRYFEACWQRRDQEPVEEALAAGDFQKVESSFRLIEDGPPTRSLFVVARRPDGELRPTDEVLWERYRDIQADQGLTPADKERRFRILRRAFYERVIQVYAPPDSDEPIQRLDAGAATYTRETGFVALPREESVCIF